MAGQLELGHLVQAHKDLDLTTVQKAVNLSWWHNWVNGKKKCPKCSFDSPANPHGCLTHSDCSDQRSAPNVSCAGMTSWDPTADKDENPPHQHSPPWDYSRRVSECTWLGFDSAFVGHLKHILHYLVPDLWMVSHLSNDYWVGQTCLTETILTWKEEKAQMKIWNVTTAEFP